MKLTLPPLHDTPTMVLQIHVPSSPTETAPRKRPPFQALPMEEIAWRVGVLHTLLIAYGPQPQKILTATLSDACGIAPVTARAFVREARRRRWLRAAHATRKGHRVLLYRLPLNHLD